MTKQRVIKKKANLHRFHLIQSSKDVHFALGIQGSILQGFHWVPHLFSIPFVFLLL